MKISLKRKKVANCQQKVGKPNAKCARVPRVCVSVCVSVFECALVCLFGYKKAFAEVFWFLAGLPFVYLCWALWGPDLRDLFLSPPPLLSCLLPSPNILCGGSASVEEQLALPTGINIAQVYSAICFEKYLNALFTQQLHLVVVCVCHVSVCVCGVCLCVRVKKYTYRVSHYVMPVDSANFCNLSLLIILYK